MRTGRARHARLTTAALAVGTLLVGCGLDGPGPLDSRTTAVSPEPTLDTSDLVLPSDGGPPEMAAVLTPSVADATGGIPVSAAGVGVAGEGDVVVDLYFDFICPYCGLLDQVNAADLEALVAEGGVTVVYHPVALLDHYSEGTAYSTRAVNAVAVVAEMEPEYVPAFINLLLAEGIQPPEGTPGLSDPQIAQIAQIVGVSSAVTDEFTSTVDFQGTRLRVFVPWTVAATALLPVDPDSGSWGTPTLLVNGEQFGGTPDQDWKQPGSLRAAVEAARG
ncbi:MAG: DsbA family protein [Micrococcales bacterium]|nr:DsbA family protein [Micrococcales bacterium]